MFPFILRGIFFSRLWPFFYFSFLSFFEAGLPAYFSNHSPFLRELNFVGLWWCTVIHHHRPQGPTQGCSVLWMHRHLTSCFKSHLRGLGNVQLIPYPTGLQQNKCREWESNFCPSASTGSQHKSNSLPLRYPTCTARNKGTDNKVLSTSSLYV